MLREFCFARQYFSTLRDDCLAKLCFMVLGTMEDAVMAGLRVCALGMGQGEGGVAGEGEVEGEGGIPDEGGPGGGGRLHHGELSVAHLAAGPRPVHRPQVHRQVRPLEVHRLVRPVHRQVGLVDGVGGLGEVRLLDEHPPVGLPALLHLKAVPAGLQGHAVPPHLHAGLPGRGEGLGVPGGPGTRVEGAHSVDHLHTRRDFLLQPGRPCRPCLPGRAAMKALLRACRAAEIRAESAGGGGSGVGEREVGEGDERGLTCLVFVHGGEGALEGGAGDGQAVSCALAALGDKGD